MNKIQSCGGLVVNEKHQLLLIYKKNSAKIIKKLKVQLRNIANVK